MYTVQLKAVCVDPIAPELIFTVTAGARGRARFQTEAVARDNLRRAVARAVRNWPYGDSPMLTVSGTVYQGQAMRPIGQV